MSVAIIVRVTLSRG